MILVDNSVVVEYQRSADPKLLHLFQTLSVGVCGLTRAEFLHGGRSPAERAFYMRILALFGSVSIPDALWGTVGDNLALLRSKGVTIPFADVAVATVAIANGYELWARDHHFPLVQSVLPALRLFVEPP
ncbi:MAG TPA: hypothetical protein VFG68_04470 [Fimbriiglobus sp.]|nr:hypothetical protein [Fimbriiglobus sp.]